MTDQGDRRSQKERMLAGDLYIADDPQLQEDSRRALELADRYNRTSIRDVAERRRLLCDLLGSVGEGV